MDEFYGDMWELDCDVRCILTNTFVYDGKNPMGGGVAAEAARRFPWLPAYYGRLLLESNTDTGRMHGVFLIPPKLLMFPTIDNTGAHLGRIFISLIDTKALADIYGWTRIALPRPGAGIGGLPWDTKVKPFLEKALRGDDRFVICHKEAVPRGDSATHEVRASRA